MSNTKSSMKPGDLVKLHGVNKKKRFGIITEGPY